MIVGCGELESIEFGGEDGQNFMASDCILESIRMNEYRLDLPSLKQVRLGQQCFDSARKVAFKS